MTRIKYVMGRELREQQFVTPSEMEQASATLRQAVAQVRFGSTALDRAQLELDRLAIEAPVNEVQNFMEAVEGQLVVAASMRAPIIRALALRWALLHRGGFKSA